MQQMLLAGSQIKTLANFANFYPGGNAATVNFLQQLSVSSVSEAYVYLWGKSGSGRSHLLQALVHQAHVMHRHALYIPLQYHQQLRPEMLEEIESSDLVCIDDIDSIANQIVWEEALFDAYNRIHDSNCQLVVAGNQAPQKLPLALADLRSRLCAGLSLQLQPLTDDEKQRALQFVAKLRGFELSDSVGHYLLTHCGRKQGDLFAMLTKLDEASLVAKRKLTIPFVKQILGEKTCGK